MVILQDWHVTCKISTRHQADRFIVNALQTLPPTSVGLPPSLSARSLPIKALSAEAVPARSPAVFAQAMVDIQARIKQLLKCQADK